MDAERWEKIESLYHAALQRDPAERETFLQAACEGDVSLLGEVKTLLMFQEKNNTFLENPALNQAAKLLVTHQNQLAFGQTFANYKVLTLLGAGGMGEVYLAEDNLLGRKVALKVLPQSLVHNPALVQRFQKEARAASVLNHPNILTVYEVGQDKSGLNYIATEYIEGETLRQMLAGGKELELSQILDIAVQTASGLAAAHRAGVIHRDIKPQNIMVRRDGYVKILDFGIAKLVENPQQEQNKNSSLRTEAGMILGTANYMSPEQARGLKVDARTDIWSLGVTLYELVTRQAPFTGVTTTDVIVSILEREPPPISEIVPDAPPELIHIINKCLEKDAADRYQTADEAAAELRQLKENPVSKGFLKIVPRRTSDNGKTVTEENNQTTADDNVKQKQPASNERQRTTNIFAKTIFRPSAAVAAILLTFAVGITLTYSTNQFKWLNNFPLWSKPAPSFQDAKINRLTNTGNVAMSHVSPDGKYVGYVVSESGGNSLWVRQIAAPPPRLILAANGDSYRGLTFSPDSNFIYYTIHEKAKGKGVLYSISVLGGEPRRILEDVDSPVAFSPDGKSFAFIYDNSEGEQITRTLNIADLDTTKVRRITTSEAPNLFSLEGFTWLTNGNNLILNTTKVIDTSLKYMHLVEVNLADGGQRVIGVHQWKEIGRVSSLKDNTIIFSALENSLVQSQIVQLSYPNGEIQRVTKDLSDYRSVSVANDGKTILAVQTDLHTHIWTAPAHNPSEIKQITPGVGRYYRASWTPEGKIIYTSEESGNQDIWIMDADGRNSKQLTFHAASDITPRVSPNGRYIVFASNRNGVFNLWRMERDGSNATQLTHGIEDGYPYFSADGQNIYYSSLASGKWYLFKVSVEGGQSAQMLNFPSYYGASSLDGKWIICEYVDEKINSKWDLAIISAVDEKLIKSIERPTNFNRLITRWMPDSQSLTYIDLRNNVQNLWIYKINEEQSRQLTNFNSSEEIFHYDWSFDGKNIVFLRGNRVSNIVSLTN